MSRRVALALAFLPPAVMAWFIFFYGVDVPYVDQWHFAPYLARDHHVGFFELAAFHNEHRLLFPRLVMLLLAHATHWNVKAEMWFTFLCGAAILIVLWRRLKSDDVSPWALPLMALLVFTFAQEDNFIWGWQLQMPLSVLGLVAGLAVASGPTMTRLRLAAVVALGAVAQYSFANGVFYWPLAAAVIWASHRRALAALVLLCAGALSTGLYLVGYWTPLHAASLGHGKRHPLSAAAYALVYLGQSLLPGAAVIEDWNLITWRRVVAGVLALVGLVVIVITARRSRGDEALRRRTAFAVAIAAYAVASGALTAMGRVFAGVGQATQSRYVAISMLFWVAVVALVGRLRGWRWVLAPVTLMALWAQVAMIPVGLENGRQRRGLREDLIAGKRSSYPGLIIVEDPEIVVTGRDILRDQHLSCFRGQ